MTYSYFLDKDLFVHIGWSAEFEPNDVSVIHAEFDPRYALCAKVGEESQDDYEHRCMPWDTDTGEVFNSEISFSRTDQNLHKIAENLILCYHEIRGELDNGTLTF
jgi:hypothetical protein